MYTDDTILLELADFAEIHHLQLWHNLTPSRDADEELYLEVRFVEPVSEQSRSYMIYSEHMAYNGLEQLKEHVLLSLLNTSITS
jgi:hypothetical protein